MSARDRALAAWARKVVKNPNGTVPADVDALRQAGLAEREIVEATLFVAFRLAFSTVNDALGAQPDWQLGAAAPPEVAEAVDFGRPVAASRPSRAQTLSGSAGPAGSRRRCRDRAGRSRSHSSGPAGDRRPPRRMRR